MIACVGEGSGLCGGPALNQNAELALEVTCTVLRFVGSSGGELINAASTGCTQSTSNISTYSPPLKVRRTRSPAEISPRDVSARFVVTHCSDDESWLAMTGRLLRDELARN